MVGVAATPTIHLPYTYYHFCRVNERKERNEGNERSVRSGSKVYIFHNVHSILYYWFGRAGSEGVFTGRAASKFSLP